jgi:hypothetical protein
MQRPHMNPSSQLFGHPEIGGSKFLGNADYFCHFDNFRYTKDPKVDVNTMFVLNNQNNLFFNNLGFTCFYGDLFSGFVFFAMKDYFDSRHVYFR